MTITAV